MTEQEAPRQPVPPFTAESAAKKVQAATDLWNTRDPSRVPLGYTKDSVWEVHGKRFVGREKIKEFLTDKWSRELDYRLEKRLFCFNGNRIAVQFNYEYHDESGQWYRAYGNEHWDFDERGFMATRTACINTRLITEAERLYRWERKTVP